MKAFVRLLLIILVGSLPTSLFAQTAISANWANLGKADFEAVGSGSTLSVGPNTISIATRVNRDGDGNDANFLPYYSSEMLSYYSANIGTKSEVLLYSMDHSIFDAGDYFETVFSLATSVTNLSFTVTNMDRQFVDYRPYFNYVVQMHDAVVVEYDTGDGTWRNLRDLGGAANFNTAGVQTATIGGQRGYHAVANNGTSANGDLAVNFGGTTVKRVRIRYLFGQQNPGNDPTGANQFIGLSGMNWTQAGVTASDLELAASVSNTSPASGSNVTYTLNLYNRGSSTASNLTVRDILPAGMTFLSAGGYGNYDAASGMWTVPSIASGQTRQLTINARVDVPGGTTLTNRAEVWTSPNYDPDSTPGNGNTGEDDYAAVGLTVQGTRTAGIPPTLSCPAGSTLFDWDTRPWAAGSLNNSYAVTGIGTIDFSVSSNGAWVNDAAFGGMSPSLTNQNNGGFAGTQVSLHQYLDFSTISQTASTVITLPTAVPGVQFTVFDIDYAANDFADKLTVTGTYNGATVTPTLTNGTANYVVGNTAYGDAGSAGNVGDGNVVVTFSGPVDTITIIYGNHSLAPADPDGQAIAIHDITFCNPVTVLGVTKVSTIISDPANGNTNPKAIPGAVIEYCILIQNPGSATATNVVGTDSIPTTLAYTAGSMLSGGTCANATTVEDDNATGSDESDPFGGSIAGNVLTASAPSLAPSAGFALKFRATVK